jgi:DNA-binding NtrC family response regulator
MKTERDAFASDTPPKWMLVDDNEDILVFAGLAIKHVCGVELACFSSAPAALEAFAAAPESFKLVITDFNMPEMDGFELRRRIHAIAPAARVLLLTGSESVSAEIAAEQGFCGLLFKPFSLDALRGLLERRGVPSQSNTVFASPIVFTAA